MQCNLLNIKALAILSSSPDAHAKGSHSSYPQSICKLIGQKFTARG